MKMRNPSTLGWKFLATTALGVGSSAALGGCDPNVRTALLGGLQTTTGTLLQTFNDAFYISLEDEDTGAADTLTTT